MGICHWKMIHFWLLDRIGAFRSVLTFYRSCYNFEGVKFESHEHTRRQIQQAFYPERCEITCMEKLKWQTSCSPTKLFSFSRVLCDKLVWEKFEVAKEAGGFCLTCLFTYSICVCVFFLWLKWLITELVHSTPPLSTCMFARCALSHAEGDEGNG